MTNPRTPEFLIPGPGISEKAYAAMATGKYVFRCNPTATKVEIAKAIEQAFADQKIKVVAVNTVNVHGKKRRRGGKKRIVGQKPDWKKATVTLAAGQKIEGLYEGV